MTDDEARQIALEVWAAVEREKTASGRGLGAPQTGGAALDTGEIPPLVQFAMFLRWCLQADPMPRESLELACDIAEMITGD